jgi:hypothetical protein
VGAGAVSSVIKHRWRESDHLPPSKCKG